MPKARAAGRARPSRGDSKREALAERLRTHLIEVRARDPIPARSALSLAEEWQCRILGGHLISWLREWGPAMIARRNAILPTRGDTDQPLVVFATDTPGVVAAAEILGPEPDGIVYCRLPELEALPKRSRDPHFRVHYELHSYFDGPDWRDVAAAARAAHPPAQGEELWIHHVADIMGPLAAQGSGHLWHWNGSEPKLIEEGWGQWVS